MPAFVLNKKLNNINVENYNKRQAYYGIYYEVRMNEWMNIENEK